MAKPRLLTGQEYLKNSDNSRRMLLVAPPIYDYRLEWRQWHHPTGLLQLASYLLSHNKDLQLIDCLYCGRGKRLPYSKVGVVELEGYTFNKWHFGLPFDRLEARAQALLNGNWEPDMILVASLNSIWWEAVRDTIKHLRGLLPRTKIILGGMYPTFEPEHAAQHSGADVIVAGSVPEVAKLPPDLSLYKEPPYSTGIYFYAGSDALRASRAPRPRATSKVLKEIQQKAALGIRELVFFDEEIRIEDREVFGELLDAIAVADLDIHFVLPGNISPRVITQDLARKMLRARVTQVYLRCEVAFGLDRPRYTTSLSEYQRCVDALERCGGFKPRSGDLAAMLVVGMPYEDLDAVCERLIRLAHIVGSVIPVPFQYVPSLHKGPLFDRALASNGSFTPEKFNSKLYLLARLSGKKLEDYMELTRLATLLNSKHRSKTFDFLGDGLAARLFRESIRTEGWNPFRTESGEALDEIIQLEPSSVVGRLHSDRLR